jgi:hypothetical protein
MGFMSGEEQFLCWAFSPLSLPYPLTQAYDLGWDMAAPVAL